MLYQTKGDKHETLILIGNRLTHSINRLLPIFNHNCISILSGVTVQYLTLYAFIIMPFTTTFSGYKVQFPIKWIDIYNPLTRERYLIWHDGTSLGSETSDALMWLWNIDCDGNTLKNIERTLKGYDILFLLKNIFSLLYQTEWFVC